MRKDKKYAPLRLFDEIGIPGLAYPDFSKYLDAVKPRFKLPDNFDILREDYVKTLLFGYDRLFTRDMSASARMLALKIKESMHDLAVRDAIDNGYSADIITNPYEEYISMRDIFLTPLLLDDWKTSKQVLAPDPEFAKCLLLTDNLLIDGTRYEHLPYDTFYVDFDPCRDNDYNPFGDAHGAFVAIRESYGNTVAIIMNILGDDMRQTSKYIVIDKSKPEYVDTSIFLDPYETNNSFASAGVSQKAVTTLILQLIEYIESEKPDIEASERTIRTYRKPRAGEIHNKFSEVQITDVGVHIGAAITKALKDASNANANSTTTSWTNGDGGCKKAPHLRRAHWHRYHTGKNRENTVLRWILPIFVNMDKDETSRDVVIHNVK